MGFKAAPNIPGIGGCDDDDAVTIILREPKQGADCFMTKVAAVRAVQLVEINDEQNSVQRFVTSRERPALGLTDIASDKRRAIDPDKMPFAEQFESAQCLCDKTSSISLAAPAGANENQI
jgi:hypothetical protein